MFFLNRFLVISVNWGRHYQPGEFMHNVKMTMEKADDCPLCVIGVQELDEEPDPANEHPQFAKALGPGWDKAGWHTREPLVFSPAWDHMRRPRVTITMPAGGVIGAPKGTGPTRHAVTAIGVETKDNQKLRVGFGNTHPHLNRVRNPKIAQAVKGGLIIFRNELEEMFNHGLPVVWTGDMNNKRLPLVMPGERTAIRRGNDYIRYKNNPDSPFKLSVVRTGQLQGTIDPHDPVWALFEATKRAA